MNTFRKWCGIFCAVVLPGMPVGHAANPYVHWIFEGEILRVDEALSPHIAEEMVWAGSFALPLYPPRSTGELTHGERYAGEIGDFEFTIDRNHLLYYAGSQRPDLQWTDVIPAEGTAVDALEFLIPVTGKPLNETDWQVAWIQMGIVLPASTLDPEASWPDWRQPVPWSSGWFRITFNHPVQTGSATLDGMVTLFQPGGDPLSPAEQIAHLEAILQSLATSLEATYAENRRLADELATQRQRGGGLLRTIDRMIEERQLWTAERQKLQASQSMDDEVWRGKITGLEAAHAVQTLALEQLHKEREVSEKLAGQHASEAVRLALEVDSLKEILATERAIRQKMMPEQISYPSVQPEDESPPAIVIIEEPVEWESIRPSPEILSAAESERTSPRSGSRRRGPRGRF